MPPKRSRAAKVAKKEEESEEDDPVPEVYPGKKNGRGMDELSWMICRDMLRQIYDAEEQGRSLSGIFEELPDEDEYEDYYQAITDPECLDNISFKLGEQAYPTTEDFLSRLNQIFTNAKIYNEEGSQQSRYSMSSKTKRGRPKKGDERPRTLPSTSTSTTNPNTTGLPSGMAQDFLPHVRPLTVGDKRIMESLDERLPKWQGPQFVIPGAAAPGGVPGSGWWGEAVPVQGAVAQKIMVVMRALQEYRHVNGMRLAESLENIPPQADIPYLSFSSPVSFAGIADGARHGRYGSPQQFDFDMARLFEKARRWHPPQSANYGNVLVLQRLYNALTAPYPLPLPASGVPEPSATLFASLPAGPGNARSLHEASQAGEGVGITTFRVGTKDRIFTPEARHKGQTFRCGDYVHLINPDDATKPIVGQVWKSFVPTKGYRTHHVTICWYYRPEQTVHTADRLFFADEVFKSSHFCDHPVEDIIERVSCQFYVKYVRGKPVIPEYYPGWPIYICNSRYNDREYLSIRIKNWASCIPEELRQTSYMNIVSYDRSIEPQILNSPFVRGIKGPGFISEPRRLANAADDEEDGPPTSVPTPQPIRQMEPVRQTPPIYRPPPPTVQQMPQVPQIPQMPQNPIPRPQPQQQPMMPPIRQHQPSPAPRLPDIHRDNREMLPAETVRLFERDPRGQVIWFSGPPLPPGSIKYPEQPTHSLQYLEYLCKRKRGESTSERTSSVKRGNGSIGRKYGNDVSELLKAAIQ